jgi:hypothetical protein
MFSSRGSPQTGFTFNILKNNHMWGMLVAKDPRIPLVPNFPKDKQGDGGHGFATRTDIGGQKIPPRLDRETRPLAWLQVGKAKPIPHGAPKSHGEPAMDEKMIDRLRHLLA